MSDFKNYFDDWFELMRGKFTSFFETAVRHVDGSTHAAKKIAQQVLQTETPPPDFISEIARLIMLENQRLNAEHRRSGEEL